LNDNLKAYNKIIKQSLKILYYIIKYYKNVINRNIFIFNYKI